MNFNPFAVIDMYFFNHKTVRTVWDEKVVSIQGIVRAALTVCLVFCRSLKSIGFISRMCAFCLGVTYNYNLFICLKYPYPSNSPFLWF